MEIPDINSAFFISYKYLHKIESGYVLSKINNDTLNIFFIIKESNQLKFSFINMEIKTLKNMYEGYANYIIITPPKSKYKIIETILKE